MLLPLSNEGELIVFLVMNPFTPQSDELFHSQ